MPTDTPLPPASATPTPGPTITDVTLSQPYVSADVELDCAQTLPSEGFILGADPVTCEAVGGGIYSARVAVPSAGEPHVVVLRVSCPGGCSHAVTGQAGAATISVDGQILWSAVCSEPGACDPLALGDGPTVAFVSNTGMEHTIELQTIGAVSWPVAAVETAWYPVPRHIQGLAYSPYRDCQNPHWGPYPTEAQVREDMELLRHMGNAIRTYASTRIEGEIPAIAGEYGLRVAAGAWLDSNAESNEQQIAALIALANTTPVESVIVGNEVLLRGDLTEEELIAYIERVKAAVSVPVTTAEIGGILLQHPAVIEAVDYLMVHIYPYWEWPQGVPIENAAWHTVNTYRQIEAQAGGKRVVIGETGWPASGPANGAAVASPENQRRYMREFLSLAQQEAIEFYYFAPFDELWKAEGGVGPYWGFMGPDRRNKYDLQSMLIPLAEAPPPGQEVAAAPVATGTPGPVDHAATFFGVYTNYAVYSGTHHDESPTDNHFAPSGWMGDLDTIHINDCANPSGEWADRAIELQYTPGQADQYGWAGIYWQYPDSNWATLPEGYDLTAYDRVSFRARSSVEGAAVKFLVGGVTNGPYPSSIRQPVFAEGSDWQGFVTLSTEWQTFTIDLSGVDRSHVIDGFGWVVERSRTPDGITVYLDDIIYLPQ